MSTVSLIRCPDYHPLRVEGAAREAIDLLGGIQRFVRPGDRVLLKINLLDGAAPEKAITTHPAVVRALIHLVREAGGVPRVGDCAGIEGPPSLSRFRGACRRAGILAVCEEEGVELAHLSGASTEVENPAGRAFKRFTLARGVVEADVVISLPKLKTHGLMLYTGGVKNLFGCIPGLLKAQMHVRAQRPESFAQMLVDLLVAVRPALTVMDAVTAMEGNGPRNGRPRDVGAILGSTDPVALDAIACQIVGIPPEVVLTTRLAEEQGVGTGELARIEVRGESPGSIRVEGFRLPAGQSGLFQALGRVGFLKDRLVARPQAVADRCKGCWTCVEHCPVGALSKNGSIPAFDYRKCISCYCCQELCPHDAIVLRRPLVARWLMP